MKHIKQYEAYNNNKLNELIVKYYNDYSEEMIDIIGTYSKPSDAEGILQKLSFIMESPGDVETIEKNDEVVAYFVDMKEVDAQTIFYDVENKKFRMNSYKNFMDSIEK